MSYSTIRRQDLTVLLRNILKWTVVVCSLFAISHWLYLGGRRFIYPYEVSWMEGSMLEQILRVLQGKSLYAVPSIEYVPWLYQPFYYFIAAGIAKVIGLSFVTARAISVISTIASGSIIGYIVHKETGKNKLLALLGVGLFFAAHGKVGYTYETARVDSLFLALLLAGSAVTIYAKHISIIIIGAFILALSYFTKQSAMLFLPGIFLFLFFKRRKDSLFFFLSIVIFILGGIFLLHLTTGGWYEYYTLGIPAAKRKTFDWKFGISEFLNYVTLRCWPITIIASIVTVLSRIRNKVKVVLSINQLIFYLFFFIALFTAILGLGNEGGGKNVLMPIAAFAGIIFPISLHIMLRNVKKQFAQILIYSLIFIQFILLFSNPYKFARNIPSAKDEVSQKEFLDSVRALPGDVWVPYHGFMPSTIGKATFAELRAYGDVLLMNDEVAHQLRHDLDSNLSAHRFTFIFDDTLHTFPGYVLKYTILNPHKAQVWVDTVMYVYVPQIN